LCQSRWQGGSTSRIFKAGHRKSTCRIVDRKGLAIYTVMRVRNRDVDVDKFEIWDFGNCDLFGI
jgi:hypothetical protein